MNRPRQVLKPSSLTNQAANIRQQQAREDALEASIMVERRRGAGIGPTGAGEPAGTAASLLSAHVSAIDPHPQYVTDADLAALAASLKSGNFTPTGATFENCTAVTPGPARYMRIGNVVTVSGRLSSVTVTAADTETSVRIDVPVLATFPSTERASGVAGHPSEIRTGSVNSVSGESRVAVWFYPTVAGDIEGIQYHYTYRIS